MKIKVWVSTKKVGSKTDTIIEIPDEELAHIPDGDERDEFVHENYAQETMFEMIDWNWEIVP